MEKSMLVDARLRVESSQVGLADRSSTPNHPQHPTAEGAACAGARSRTCCRRRVHWAIGHHSIGTRPPCSTWATHSGCRDLPEHPLGGAIQVPPSMATGRRRVWTREGRTWGHRTGAAGRSCRWQGGRRGRRKPVSQLAGGGGRTIVAIIVCGGEVPFVLLSKVWMRRKS
jgi:hypothetical protein